MEAAAGPSSPSVCVSAAQNELTELQKLSANGDPDDADVEGITALYAACQNGHEPGRAAAKARRAPRSPSASAA